MFCPVNSSWTANVKVCQHRSRGQHLFVFMVFLWVTRRLTGNGRVLMCNHGADSRGWTYVRVIAVVPNIFFGKDPQTNLHETVWWSVKTHRAVVIFCSFKMEANLSWFYTELKRVMSFSLSFCLVCLFFISPINIITKLCTGSPHMKTAGLFLPRHGRQFLYMRPMGQWLKIWRRKAKT